MTRRCEPPRIIPSVAQMRVKCVLFFFQDLLMRLRETLQVREHDPGGERPAPSLVVLFLCAAVQTAFSVGKIQVSLRKKGKTKWTSLGQPLEFHNTFVLKKERGESELRGSTGDLHATRPECSIFRTISRICQKCVTKEEKTYISHTGL